MKFRRSGGEPLSLNLTPLIDVVFLLLIFFMVSTTFDRPTELKMQLPEAEHGSAQSEGQVLSIEVLANGLIHLNGEQTDNLAAQLDQYLDDNPEPDYIRVLADEQALHRDVSHVLDTLAGADLTDIRFQTLARQ